MSACLRITRQISVAPRHARHRLQSADEGVEQHPSLVEHRRASRSWDASLARYLGLKLRTAPEIWA